MDSCYCITQHISKIQLYPGFTAYEKEKSEHTILLQLTLIAPLVIWE